jgi:hypothetical protein
MLRWSWMVKGIRSGHGLLYLTIRLRRTMRNRVRWNCTFRREVWRTWLTHPALQRDSGKVWWVPDRIGDLVDEIRTRDHNTCSFPLHYAFLFRPGPGNLFLILQGDKKPIMAINGRTYEIWPSFEITIFRKEKGVPIATQDRSVVLSSVTLRIIFAYVSFRFQASGIDSTGPSLKANDCQISHYISNTGKHGSSTTQEQKFPPTRGQTTRRPKPASREDVVVCNKFASNLK